MELHIGLRQKGNVLMKIRKCWVFLFLYLVVATINAATPDDLMFNNKPIDALCFSNPEGNRIQLNQCGLAKEKYVMKGANSALIRKGYIGYDWQSPEDSAEGYSYYKFFDAGNNLYWLYTINNGGGSGQFSGLNLVKRKSPNELDIQNLAGGDRCNGGLQDVSESNNQLTFSINLTAYDLVILSKKASSKLNAYEDLAACAVCCVGKAFYEVRVGAKPKLNYVDLVVESNSDEMPQQGSLQPCFNKLLSSYITSGKTKLKPDMLDELAVQFNQTCTQNNKR